MVRGVSEARSVPAKLRRERAVDPVIRRKLGG
jgi:hypothetical protein